MPRRCNLQCSQLRAGPRAPQSRQPGARTAERIAVFADGRFVAWIPDAGYIRPYNPKLIRKPLYLSGRLTVR